MAGQQEIIVTLDDMMKRLLGSSSKRAIGDVIKERLRQVAAEGFDSAHDDQHSNFEMAAAASTYALNVVRRNKLQAPDLSAPAARAIGWPWSDPDWKPRTPREDLVRAAALLIAEIDRLDRAEAKAAT